MKSRLTLISKFLLISVLVFTSCQRDDITFDAPSEESKQLFTIKRIETIGLNSIHSLKVKEKVKAINANVTDKGHSAVARENWSLITIDTSSVKHIITEEGYSSYTFDVLDSENHHYIENLIISHFPNDSIQTILATYYLDSTAEAIFPETLEQQITQTTFSLLDGTTQIIESSHNESRVGDCIVVGYWDEEELCKGGEAGLGDDMCNDENGQPIMVDIFVVIGDSCDWDDLAIDGSPVNGSAGPNDSDEYDEEPHNGGNTNGNETTVELPPNFVLTAPKVDLAKALIDALDLSKDHDAEVIAFIYDNYLKFYADLGLIEEIYAYLIINNFSETAKDNVEKSLRVLAGLEEVSSIDTISANEFFLKLIGGRLTKMNEILFPEHAEAWSNIDKNNNLELSDWLHIAEKGLGIYSDYLLNGEQFDYASAEEGTLFIAYLSNVKTMVGEHWPQTDEQWDALGTIMGQFLVEIGLALIPGSDIIEVTNGINDGDYVAVTLGIVGLVIDAFGGVILKAAAKIGRVAYKTFKIFKIVFRYLDEVVDAISVGLKTELTDFGVHIKTQLGKLIAKIFNNVLTLKYSGFGGDIITTPNKTTTVIGKWQDPAGGGTQEIIESGLSKSGRNNGGINALNESPDPSWNDQQIWDSINEPWLDEAIDAADVIRVVSDPLKKNNLFRATVNLDQIPNDVFESGQSLSNYLLNLSPQQVNDLSFFGREIRHLFQNGYTYDSLNNQFIL